MECLPPPLKRLNGRAPRSTHTRVEVLPAVRGAANAAALAALPRPWEGATAPTPLEGHLRTVRMMWHYQV